MLILDVVVEPSDAHCLDDMWNSYILSYIEWRWRCLSPVLGSILAHRQRDGLKSFFPRCVYVCVLLPICRVVLCPSLRTYCRDREMIYAVSRAIVAGLLPRFCLSSGVQ